MGVQAPKLNRDRHEYASAALAGVVFEKYTMPVRIGWRTVPQVMWSFSLPNGKTIVGITSRRRAVAMALHELETA